MKVFFLWSGRSPCSPVDGQSEEAGDEPQPWEQREEEVEKKSWEYWQAWVKYLGGGNTWEYVWFTISNWHCRNRWGRGETVGFGGFPGWVEIHSTVAQRISAAVGSWGDTDPGLRPVTFKHLPGSKQAWTIPEADRKSELTITLTYIPDKIPEDVSWHSMGNYKLYCLIYNCILVSKWWRVSLF